MIQVTPYIKNLFYIPTFFIACGMHPDMAMSTTILFFLMCIDMATGIVSTGTIEGWAKIKSRVAIAGLLSKLMVLLIPLVIALVGSGLHQDLTLIAVGAVYILILSEAYSVLGNIQAIRAGKKVTEFDAVSMLLKSIRKMFMKMLKNNLDK